MEELFENRILYIAEKLEWLGYDIDMSCFYITDDIKKSSSYHPETGYITSSLEGIFNNHASKVLIHEIAHKITAENIRNDKGHIVEFAIINYCLRHRILHKNTKGHTYFDSYDFSDDEIYTRMRVNPYEFDKKIENLAWRNIGELIEKAEAKANDIRATVNRMTTA